MKSAWLSMLGVVFALFPIPALGQNLIANGDFETDYAPWFGQKSTSQGIVAAPELLSHETVDTNGSAGALRLTTQDLGPDAWNHVSGAICPLTALVPAGTLMRVQFSAKGVGYGSWVSVTRVAGHRLREHTDQYELAALHRLFPRRLRHDRAGVQRRPNRQPPTERHGRRHPLR